MTAFNVVRCRVKPGREEEFLSANRNAPRNIPGLRRAAILKTGERNYCFIAEWTSFERLASARPKLIAQLDTFRDCLEDLGEGLGISDPVSGDVVLEMKAKKTARRKARKAAKKLPRGRNTVSKKRTKRR
jgi:hypothetical protein